MGKVIFRLPSKGIQYGYAEYSYDDDGDAYEIGLKYREFVTDFIAGEAAGQALERDTKIVGGTKFKRKSDANTIEEVFGKPPTEAEAIAMLDEGLGVSVYDEPVEEEAPAWEAPPPAPSADDWDF